MILLFLYGNSNGYFLQKITCVPLSGGLIKKRMEADGGKPENRLLLAEIPMIVCTKAVHLWYNTGIQALACCTKIGQRPACSGKASPAAYRRDAINLAEVWAGVSG